MSETRVVMVPTRYRVIGSGDVVPHFGEGAEEPIWLQLHEDGSVTWLSQEAMETMREVETNG